jgi:MFS family permease
VVSPTPYARGRPASGGEALGQEALGDEEDHPRSSVTNRQLPERFRQHPSAPEEPTMTATETAPTTTPANSDSGAARRVARRLRPLYAAMALGGVALWVPVEKLFMAELGFDPASVGVMAGVYALVVPLLEVPSGVLADRWSRKGVLVAAYAAILASVLVCGLATDVTTYVLGAGLLGVYIALQSGTLDSMLYDVLVEELGASETFESTLGRFRAVESVALAGSALAGGALAMLTSPRVTYFATLPMLGAAVVLISRFREPKLHQTEEREPLRTQITTTFRTVVDRGQIRPIVVVMVLTSLLLQATLEFGPLWMVALAAPAFLYGAQWAGLTGALGLGGLLAARLHLDCRYTLGVVGGVLVAAALTISTSHNIAVILPAQVAMVLALIVVSVHATGLLHNAIPSTIRAGVSSGVSTLTWLVFLPFAVVFGFAADRVGVNTAGWLVVGIATTTAVGLTHLVQPATRCARATVAVAA